MSYLYTKAKEKILSGQINLASDTLKVALVSDGYVANAATHEFLTALNGFTIGTAQALTGATVTNGVFDAADVAWSAVPVGSTAAGVVIYKDTGNPDTSPLLVMINYITGFPLVTNGGDITVQWDNGSYRIFTL